MASKRRKKSGKSGSLSGLVVLALLFGLFTFRRYVLILILIAASIFIVRKLRMRYQDAQVYDPEFDFAEDPAEDLAEDFAEDPAEDPAEVSAVFTPLKLRSAKDPGLRHYAYLPLEMDGCHLSYDYRFPFDILDYEPLEDYVKNGSWDLSAKYDCGIVRLFAGDCLIGRLNFKQEMLADWIQKGLPYKIVVESIFREAGGFLKLGFYRNNLEYFKNNEQSVVALTAYKREEVQDAVRFLKENSMVCIDVHEENDQIAIVTDGCDVIGRLPKKAAERFFAEEIVFAVVDHVKETSDDDGNDLYAPYIRLYFD